MNTIQKTLLIIVGTIMAGGISNSSFAQTSTEHEKAVSSTSSTSTSTSTAAPTYASPASTSTIEHKAEVHQEGTLPASDTPPEKVSDVSAAGGDLDSVLLKDPSLSNNNKEKGEAASENKQEANALKDSATNKGDKDKGASDTALSTKASPTASEAKAAVEAAGGQHTATSTESKGWFSWFGGGSRASEESNVSSVGGSYQNQMGSSTTATAGQYQGMQAPAPTVQSGFGSFQSAPTTTAVDVPHAAVMPDASQYQAAPMMAPTEGFQYQAPTEAMVGPSPAGSIQPDTSSFQAAPVMEAPVVAAPDMSSTFQAPAPDMSSTFQAPAPVVEAPVVAPTPTMDPVPGSGGGGGTP